MLDPILHTQFAIYLDLALKGLGASGVLAILVILVRLAYGWGQMEKTVENGFATNSKDHAAILESDKAQHEMLGGKIDAQGRKIDAAVVRIDDLHHSVGVLQGKGERKNAG